MALRDSRGGSRLADGGPAGEERHASALNTWELKLQVNNPIRRHRPIYGNAAAATLPRSLHLLRIGASSQTCIWIHYAGNTSARWLTLHPWDPLGEIFDHYARSPAVAFEYCELEIAHMRLFAPPGEGRRLDRHRSLEELHLADSAHVEVYLDAEIPTDGWRIKSYRYY